LVVHPPFFGSFFSLFSLRFFLSESFLLHLASFFCRCFLPEISHSFFPSQLLFPEWDRPLPMVVFFCPTMFFLRLIVSFDVLCRSVRDFDCFSPDFFLVGVHFVVFASSSVGVLAFAPLALLFQPSFPRLRIASRTRGSFFFGVSFWCFFFCFLLWILFFSCGFFFVDPLTFPFFFPPPHGIITPSGTFSCQFLFLPFCLPPPFPWPCQCPPSRE